MSAAAIYQKEFEEMKFLLITVNVVVKLYESLMYQAMSAFAVKGDDADEIRISRFYPYFNAFM